MKFVIFLIISVCLIKTALTLEYKEYEYDGEYDEGREERILDEAGETEKVNSYSAHEKHDTNDYYYDEGAHKQSEEHEISSQPNDSQKSHDYDYDDSRSIKQSSNSHNTIPNLDTQSKPVANKDSAQASQDYQYYDEGESSKLRSETQNNGPASAFSSLSSQTKGSVLSSLGGGSVLSSLGGGSALSSLGGGSALSSLGGGSALSSLGGGSALSSLGGGSALSSLGGGSALSSLGGGSALSSLGGGSVSASVTNSASKLPRPIYDIKDAQKLFNKFKQDFNKNYKDAADEKKHFDNFVKNLEDINKTNSNPTSSYTQDINQFADWGKEEEGAVEGFGDDY